MGRKALVDYKVIAELCERVKKTDSTFVGRVKETNDRPTGSESKVDQVKRVLLSKRGKKERTKKEIKRARGNEGPPAKKTTFRQRKQSDTSGTSGSDTGSDSESNASSFSDESESGERDTKLPSDDQGTIVE